VEHFPEIFLTDNQALRISQGVPTSIAGIENGKYRLKSSEGVFIGIGTADDGRLKPDKVINPFR